MTIKLKNLALVAATAIAGAFSGGAASAATWTPFGETSPLFTISCTGCTILAYLDNDGNGYTFAGSLGAQGTAFNPVAGNPSDRNPDLTGEADEKAFLANIADIFGDDLVAGSYKKTDKALGPVMDGQYALWKSGLYAGVLKIVTAGTGWSYTGTPGLSHFATMDIKDDGGSGIDPVPVPASLPLLIGALGLTGYIARRRKAA